MRSMTMAVTVLMLAGCASGEPVDYAELSRQGADGVAIDGYSPVSYFTRGESERGSSEFAVLHNGVTYWLTDASQVEVFNTDPDRYQPAHGGWCSLMLSGSGRLTPANPESFKIVDDKLLLFWSGDFNGQPVDGMRNWESKFDDAAGETALLAKADATWRKLLSGKAKQKVSLFSPADGERVSPARRESAKREYE